MHSKTLTLILAAALVLAFAGNLAAGERGRRGDFGDSGRFGPGGHGQRRGMPGQNRSARHRPAGPRGFGFGGFGFGGFGPAGWSRLDLTPEQKSQAIDVLTTHFRAGLEAGMALQDAQAAVRELRRSASTDADAIIAAHRALGEARGQLEVARLKARGDFAAILTPEQREKLKRFGHGRRDWNADADADTDTDDAAGLDPDAGLDADEALDAADVP